jgi:DNA polymerase-3 subunit epsilon
MTPDRLSRARLAVIDLETSGSVPGRDRIVEIGLVEIEGLAVVDVWTTLVRPPLPAWPPAGESESLKVADTSGAPGAPPASGPPGALTAEILAAPVFDSLAPGLAARLGLADAIVCHNAAFDMRFLQLAFTRVGVAPVNRPVIDTLAAARAAWGRGENSLGEVAARCGIRGEHQHRALPDARLTAGVLIHFASHLGEEFPLEEFPGYVAEATAYLAKPSGLPYRSAVGKYTPSPDEPGPQHRSVMLMLLRSAARTAREVSLVMATPGGSSTAARVVPLRIEGNTMVVRRLARPAEEAVSLDRVTEVRW